MATLARRYDCDETLPHERQNALADAYQALRCTASMEAKFGSRFHARYVAEQCRGLIAAFGVRRERRVEVTAERRAQARAEFDAKMKGGT